MDIPPETKQKRKLMPLLPRNPDFYQMDFNPTVAVERLKPECPYLDATKPKPKESSPSLFKASSQENVAPSNASMQADDKTHTPSVTPSLDFQPKKQKMGENIDHDQNNSFKNVTNASGTKSVMVCTYMHRNEVDMVADAVRKLGGFQLEPNVTRHTSHLICGDEKRTVNLLRGIVYGCWILNHEWVKRSLAANQWIEEAPFELKKFPSIKQRRIMRQTYGQKSDLFEGKAIYVAQKTSPPRSDLVVLLNLSGALVVNSASRANIIVTPSKLRVSRLDVTQVNEKWVLDSIQENVVQEISQYSLDTTP